MASHIFLLMSLMECGRPGISCGRGLECFQKVITALKKNKNTVQAVVGVSLPFKCYQLGAARAESFLD